MPKRESETLNIFTLKAQTLLPLCSRFFVQYRAQ